MADLRKDIADKDTALRELFAALDETLLESMHAFDCPYAVGKGECTCWRKEVLATWRKYRHTTKRTDN